MRTPKTKTITPARIETLLAGIAQGRLGIDTFEPRGLDRFDFQEVHLAQLRRALLQAYTQGYHDGAHDRGAGLDALVALLGMGEAAVSATPDRARGTAAHTAQQSRNSGPARGFPTSNQPKEHTMPATRNERTLPIVEQALANRIAAHKAGNIGPATEDGRKADLAVKAAYIALKAHADMSWLRDKLNEAIGRVEAAENTKDAYLALAWLRTSLWDDVQTALTKLEAYDDLLG